MIINSNNSFNNSKKNNFNNNNGFNNNGSIKKQPFTNPQNKSNKVNNFILYDKNKYKDISNHSDMINKSIAVLQERLDSGLIDLDEFNQMASKINKNR